MQYFNKVKSYFSGKADPETEETESQPASSSSTARGFTSRQQVQVPRQPVLQSAGYSGSGGVQGLDWYKARLKTDRDGDLADEFLLEPNVGSSQPADKPLKVQQRNVRDAALQNADLYVDHGQVLVLQDEKSNSRHS